ncbi:MAG: hypothetical protein KBD31_00030 [Proteobacteria bacterium]|nr:hypothetical protein [Pseudomonadota bacterium]
MILIFYFFLVNILICSELSNCDGYNDDQIERKRFNNNIKEKIDRFGYVYLTGFGGMGKSQIAIQYGQKNKKTYNIVWLIDAQKDIHQQIEDIQKKICKIKKINTIESNNTDSSINNLDKILKKEKMTALLIIDSDENKNENFNVTRKRKNIKFLITTRENPHKQSQITVSFFEKNEAVSFLKSILQNEREEVLNDLAKTLDYYPLLINQSAYFLQQNSAVDIKEYMKRYKKNLKQIWQREEDFYHKNQQVSVRSTLRISLNKMIMKKPSSVQILSIFCLLKNQQINKSYIFKIASLMNLQKEETEDILSFLINNHFIYLDVDKSEFFIHELLQDALLIELPSHKIYEALKNITSDIQKTIQENKDNMIVFSKNNPFIIETAFKCTKLCGLLNQSIKESTAICIYLLDYLLYIKRDHLGALKYIDKIFKNIQNITNIGIKCRFFSSAGDVLSIRQPNEKRTKDVLKKMIHLLSVLDNSEKFERVRLQNSIAQNYLLSLNAEEAKKYINLSLRDIEYFSRSENIIPTYYFATWIYCDLEDYKKAIYFAEKAIIYFKDVPDTAIKFYTYNFNALAYIRIKDYKKGLELSSLSVEKCMEYFGGNPSDTLGEALTYKAESSLKLLDYKCSLQSIEKALSVYKEFYGSDQKTIDQAYSNMIHGDCNLLKKSYDMAQKSYMKGLSILQHLKVQDKSILRKRNLIRLIYTTQKTKQNALSKDLTKTFKKTFTNESLEDLSYDIYDEREFLNKYP